MSVKRQTHAKALTDLTEVMTIAFILALFADSCWVIRDMVVYGVTTFLLLVASALWTALITVTHALIIYHKQQVKIILKTLLAEKLMRQKIKMKKRK